jgi:hypothetical protein
VPGPAVALTLLVALVVVYWRAGAFGPAVLAEYAGSARQITGMALMLILLPAYLIGATSLAERRWLSLVEEIRAGLTDPAEADAAVHAIRYLGRKLTPLAGLPAWPHSDLRSENVNNGGKSPVSDRDSPDEPLMLNADPIRFFAGSARAFGSLMQEAVRCMHRTFS